MTCIGSIGQNYSHFEHKSGQVHQESFTKGAIERIFLYILNKNLRQIPQHAKGLEQPDNINC